MVALRLLLVGRWRRALMPSLAVAVLIGAIGGLVLASATAARQVESSYTSLLSEVDAPDLIVRPACAEALLPLECITASRSTTDDTTLTQLSQLNALSVVLQARSFVGIRPFLIDANGAPLLATLDDPSGCRQDDRIVELAALAAGGPTEQAHPFRLEGRLPASGTADTVMPRSTAERLGLEIGAHVSVAGWCDASYNVHRFGKTVDLVLTGLSIGPIDVEPPEAGRTIEPLYVDSTVFGAMTALGAQTEGDFAVWLEPTATLDSVSTDLAQFEVLIDINERASAIDRALASDARLLWLLAAVGAVGGTLVLWPVIGRNIRDTGPEALTLSALGATRRQIARQAIAHGITLALVGGASAAVLGVPIGAIMPRGLAVAIEPDRQLTIDWAVTFTGVGVIGVVVFLISLIASWRTSIARSASRTGDSRRGDGAPHFLRMPPAAQTGVQAALGIPAGTRRSNPWTSLIPMILLATVGIASTTYLASLRHLQRTPSLLGWNWNAIVGIDADNREQVKAVTDRISEANGVDQVTATVAFPTYFPTAPDMGLPFIWPWVFATGRDAITPTMLTGRAPAGPDELAIDPVFAERTGLRVGDDIALARPALALLIGDDLRLGAQELGLDSPTYAEIDDEPAVKVFEVTGIAILPLARSQSIAQAAFTVDGFASFGFTTDDVATVRAWLPEDLAPELRARAEAALSNAAFVERAVMVRYSGDEASMAAVLAGVDGVSNVLAPTEQGVWQQIGLRLDRADRIPVSLAIVVASLFVTLMAFLLFASVRARRFEFAVMRALGMSTGGLRRSVMAQATASATVSMVVAIPCGLLVGRWAWLTYARDLDVLPVAVTPWAAIAVLALATIAIAIIAAVGLGQRTTARSPAADLRSE